MPEERMVLAFELRDARTITRSLKAAADESERAAAATSNQRQEADAAASAYNRMADAASRANAAASGGSGGGSSPARSRFGTAPNRAERFPVGVYQRAQQAEELYNRHLRDGGSTTDLRGRDLRLNLDRATRARDKADNPGGAFEERLGSAIYSSRFGLGNASPLVGKALNVAGIGQKDVIALLTRPLTLAGAGLAQFAKSAYEAAEAAAKVGTEFINLRTESGGNASEAARLRSLGISGGAARSLAERLANDPVASGLGARFGARSIPGPYGTTDTADPTLKLVEGLRNLPEREQQRYQKVFPELRDPSIQRLLRVSDDTFNSLKRDAGVSERLNSSQFEKDVSEFNTAKDRVKKGFEDWWESFGGAFVRPATGAMNWLADRLRDIADPNVGSAYVSGGAPGQRGGATTPSRSDAAQMALDENNRLMAENNIALQRLSRNFGESERTRGALPGAIRGPNLHRELAAKSLNLGML